MESTRHVLVVDDDDIFRQVEMSVLTGAGYVVDQADGGATAIEKLKNGHVPDLVLLDILMPRVNGWEVLEHIRGIEPRPRVVVVSGVREIVPPGQLGQCITGYVFKPFRVPELLKTCADVLSAPSMMASGGARKEARRTFIADATVLGEAGVPVARGRIVQVSTGGFRMELTAAVEPGRPVTIAFHVPGHREAIQVTGLVRWRDMMTIGAEVTSLSGSDEAVLRALVDLA
jgi:CheY-like chemotaxis protein